MLNVGSTKVDIQGRPIAQNNQKKNKDMLLSTVETVSDLFKKSGYSALALALKQLIKNGQRKLAAMIVVALCLAPRKKGIENSGVRRILRNISLFRLANADMDFVYELQHQADNSANPNKVNITLRAFGWQNVPGWSYWPNKQSPWLQANDGCIYLNWKTDHEDRQGFQRMLCDHAGCQQEKYFPHFRMIRKEELSHNVSVFGKQFDRDHRTLTESVDHPNGYREYWVPAETVLYGFGDKDGRTLADLLEPGVWYNYYFQPDKALDLVDHEAEQQLAEARQGIANEIIKFGMING